MKALSCCLLLGSLVIGFAATVKDRAGAVRNDRAAFESDSRWIYNDFQKGFAEAKRTGKPLLVVLRCIPCLACAGIDAAVLLQESDLASVLDKFVCVRVIDANALDLKRFQFDYDLSFSMLFFNGDGTVYGRYGSWRHQKDPHDKTTAGLKRALQATLEIHRGYPANKAALAGKQGGELPFKRPVDIPSLAAKYKPELDWDGQVVQSCVHCHQVGEALRQDIRTNKKLLPIEMIYSWPKPETVGISLAADHVARVESVAPGSAAEKAGLKIGDDLVSLAGQRLISIADVGWVLHQAPASGPLPVNLKRDGRELKLNLALLEGWRAKTDVAGRVSAWNLRGMATGGLVLEDLSDESRASRAIAQDKMGFLVKIVGQYGTHAAAKRAGFQKDDVIVELDGKTGRMTEGELLGYLLQHHAPGEQLKTVVVRGGERVELALPIQ